jgi:hypothetical protein
MTEEQYLREQLAILHRQYLKDAQPYLDRLARIISIRPPEPIMFSIETIPLAQFMAQFEEGDEKC